MKSKKGSSLIIVILVMAVLMIIGTAMLSLSLSAYEYRKIEQNKKTSLYASEGGLDEAYEILGKFVEQGITQGNVAVEEYNKNLDLLLIKLEKAREMIKKCEQDDKQLNENLKNIKPYVERYLEEHGSIRIDVINKERAKIFNNGYSEIDIESKIEDEKPIMVYNEFLVRDNDVVGYNQFIENGKFSEINEKGNTEKVDIKEKIENNSYAIKLDNGDGIEMQAERVENVSKDARMLLSLKLNSKYIHDSIKREIEAIYEIKEAKYNATYDLPIKFIKFSKVALERPILVNKDMNILEGKVNIKNGDIYVKGNDDGGINLVGSNVSIDVQNGNIVTGEDLKFVSKGNQRTQQNSIKCKKNIYAKNLLINKGAENVNVNVEGSLYLLDDMEFNEKNATVTIGGGFYGVGDGSYEKNPDNDPDKSSSIIINTDDFYKGGKSKLDIRGDTIIAGTSYIGLNNNVKYQTGESISVIGNYRAYTEELEAEGNFNKSNIQFTKPDPLRLAEKFNQIDGQKDVNMNAFQKSNYFKEAYDEFGKNNYIIKPENISINENVTNIHAGAIFSNSKGIIENNWNENLNKQVKARRIQIKNQILYMGLAEDYEKLGTIGEIDKTNDIDKFNGNNEKYLNIENEKNYRQKINDFIDFDKIQNASNKVEVENNIITILNKDENMTYLFEGKGIISVPNGYKQSNIRTISLNSNNEYSGIIITNGDVIISGEFNFNGVIICNGNLIFSGSGDKNINYDSSIVDSIIIKNYKVFTGVLKNYDSYDSKKYVLVKVFGNGNIKPSDNEKSDQLVVRRNWRLVK